MVKMVLLAMFIAAGLSMKSQNLDNLTFGTDSTLEVVTWNIERFPKNGQATLTYVVDIIEALDVDVIALQEIDSKSRFEELVDNLDGWEGFYSNSEFAPLAYLYKTDVIAVREIYQIYTSLSRVFPRPPFVMDLEYRGERIILINNHFKCCGDGVLESGDDWDEETRRLHASNMLDEYVSAHFPEINVMILGDLNDIITDDPGDNVFRAFTDAPEKYAFADMDIANGNFSGWSFPNWPSHIDHILVTNELFDELESGVSEVRTIKVDEFLDGGFDEYDENISDHRPVGLKIEANSEVVSAGDLTKEEFKFYNYPNPFKHSTTIIFDPTFAPAEVLIYNGIGQMVRSYTTHLAQNSIIWDATGLPDGAYYVVLVVQNETRAITKIVMMN